MKVFHMLVVEVFIATVSVLLCGQAGAATVIDAPLPVTVAVGARHFPQFETLEISPDGRFVAYALKDQTRVTEPTDTPTTLYTKTGVPNLHQGCDVWLTDLRDGRTVNLTKGFGSSWRPVWSRNGRYLAFLSDRGGTVHLWLWDRVFGQQRRISSAIVHDTSLRWGMIHWVDGDSKILAPLVPQGMSIADADDYDLGYVVIHNGRAELSHATVRVYTNDPHAPNNAETLAHLQSFYGNNGDPFDYALIDVTSGKSTRIFHRRPVEGVAISDDQRYAVMKQTNGAAVDQHDQILYDLVVVSLVNGKKLFSIRNVPMALNWLPSWQPGKDELTYTTGALYPDMATKQYGELGQSYLVSVPDGSSRKITSDAHPSFGFHDSSAAWSPDGKHRYYILHDQDRIWVADVGLGTIKPLVTHFPFSIRAFVTMHDDRVLQRAAAIYVLTQNPYTEQEGIAAIDSISGKITAQFLGNQHISGSSETVIAASPVGTSIAYLAEDATHPWDIWSIDPGLEHSRQLTHLNPALERYRYGKPCLVTWSAPDGQRYRGALMLPSNYVPGHRYPTIIYQYPSEEASHNLNIFGGESGDYFQLYATRGYAVFMPDMIWSKYKYADLTNGRAVLWLNSVLDKLVALGISEANNFGLEGASSGGYSALAFITQTHRLKAVIADSGFASELSLYTEFSQNGNATFLNSIEGTIGGTPWTSLSKYITLSPFFKFNRITTPVMIVHGTGTYVQQKEADEAYVALRRLNKEVTYVIYEGDGHVHSNFIYPHEVDYWNRAIDWYNRHLK